MPLILIKLEILSNLEAMVKQLSTLLGAIAFYTCIPVPQHWLLTFNGIARWAPLVGLIIGGVVGLLDLALASLTVPLLTRSAIVVAVWLALQVGYIWMAQWILRMGWQC